MTQCYRGIPETHYSKDFKDKIILFLECSLAAEIYRLNFFFSLKIHQFFMLEHLV